MSKDYFQRNIELMNDLRTQQFKVREYISRGKYKMKQKFFNKGKKHYDFDLNSQEYFHEELYDIAFQNSEIQQHFTSTLMKLFQEPNQYRNQSKFQIEGLGNRKNQSEARHSLLRFFNCRVQDLQYEKYQILQRLHNINAEQQINFVKSRINLIDKQIQMSINRSDRLSCEDYFQQTYTLGGKPVPVNENGQSIYKYLQQEQCWFSNVHRDDILIYTRNKLFRRDILHKHFYPLYYEHKQLVKTHGLDMLIQNEQQLAKHKQYLNDNALKRSKNIIDLYEERLQQISPGNLIQKQNISSFIFNIFGVEEHQLPLDLPLYPSIYLQLFENYNQILPFFFKSLQIRQHKQLITLMPKFNNFCAILFKYQNKQILEGKQEIKLGLEGDIDIKKELHTMLEEIWVNKFVKTDFDRFDIRYRLQVVDWPLDTITDECKRQKQHKQSAKQPILDSSTRQLINIMKSTNYNMLRKHLKRHSQSIFNRINTKFYDMENINKYNVLTNQEQTLEHLGKLFRIKFNEQETHVRSMLKQNAKLFFEMITKKYLLMNPVQIQLEQMLRTIKIRQTRVKIMNIFNGMRCYHRNLALDLRVISNMEFSFHLDDEMLINSNKQTFQNFQKAVKQTQTYFSKESNQKPLKLLQQQFVQHQTYEKSKLYKRDKVTCHFYGQTIPHILVNHGKRLKNKILYDIVNTDIEEMEQRILEYATNVINRYQRYLKINMREELVDRIQLLSSLYDLQLRYQYEKFKLIEAYYYIYQNTKEPLNAYKISKIIVNLIYKMPEIDADQTSFAYCYQLSIQSLRQELKIVNHLTQKLQSVEIQKCKIFHDKFGRSLNIPLTLQAFLYGDLQKKGNKIGNKLPRMNSSSSKLSKQSKNIRGQEKNLKMQNEIKEQGQEDDSDESFDLQNYDEYLLKKNMDAIFDDMVGGDQNGHVKQASPVNTVAIENIVVNPKFEGGPHIKTKVYPQFKITSEKNQFLVNFSQTLHVIGNIRYIIQTLRDQFENEYGFCSKLYQNSFTKILVKKMYNACLSPQALPPKWINFQTDDPYQETVTRSMRYYQQMMAPCLQPPSNVQLAIPSTMERHHQKIPGYAALQYFDYHSIDSLIKLKKPINTFRNKQHNLGINFLQLLQLQDRIWKIQLQRRGFSKSYQNIATHCDVIMQKSLSEYTITGQSEIFLSTQQIKMCNNDLSKYPVFCDVIDEIRQYVKCQLSDVEVFKKYVEFSKRQLQNLIIMKYEIDRNFINKRIDKTRILAPKDPKDIKKIKGRIMGMISVRAGEILRQNNFLKFKNKLKILFQSKLKQINETDYEKRIENKEKMSGLCVTILTTKYKRYLQLKLMQQYSKDLILTANSLLVGTQTCKLIKKINNYVKSVPFLSKLFVCPTQDLIIDTKILYDQGKLKKLINLQSNMIVQGQIKNAYYIYTLEQYLEEWCNNNHAPMTTNLEHFNTIQMLKDLNPPATKQNIFKWAFNIPDLAIDPNQRDAYRHLINLFHPFTGKLTQLSYKQASITMPEPPRNKYLTLMNYYKSIVDYIQANIFIISLQIEEDLLISLENIIKKNINFEDRYFITDENSIRQTINTLENQDLSSVLNYMIDFAEMNKQVEKKIFDKNYLEKKQHWVVHDEVTDFILSKVLGHGLIRQSYLPLYQDLKSIKNIKGNPTEFLRVKTNNIYKVINLSSYQTYLNEINESKSDYFAYFNKINEWLCHCYKLQDYTVEHGNKRINIRDSIEQNEDEKERYANGIYVDGTNTLVNRLKHLAIIPSIDLGQFFEKLIYKSHNQEQIFSYSHNNTFLQEGMNMCKLMGQQNRLKLFARIRYYHDLSQNFISTKPSNLNLLEKQVSKSSFYDMSLSKKVFTMGCIAFSGKIKLAVNAKQFKEVYMELKEVNQIYTHNLYENLERFKEQNKIQFSKSEISLIGKNEGANDEEYNRTIKQVLSFKLLKEQFRFRILQESIRLLKAERLPKQQPKRIINTSLIPRVHLISSYSSPLISERKTYISQQYKLSFLQAFINRFRNKVSRVDLLSSGYGFVITVPDLQDCVNYMNKLLFTFTQKQFKNRIETFSQYYQILIEAVNQKNKTINEQQALIKYLQNKNNNLLEAEYLSKVTKLLHEKTVVEDKLIIVENNINGLEDRVRKVIQIQYDKKISKLQKQNQQLKSIFSKVKHLHMINTKQAAKNDFLDIINYYKEKINELLSKKVDFTISFDDNKSPQKNTKVRQEQNSDKYRSEEEMYKDKYVTEDLQKCKIGQDILFDPYYTTKLINKMRLFNLFKMGSKRLKFDQQQFRKDQKLTELHKIQDSVVAQSQREITMRSQLNRIQEDLSRKCLQLQKLKQNFDIVQNEKTKLKILMQSKQKKIEQKDRQIDQMRKIIDEKQKAANTLQKQKIQEQKDIPKLTALRKEKKYKKLDKTAFVTNLQQQSSQNVINPYERFELSSKDSTWRQKCQQLYIQNKKLQAELQRYQNLQSLNSVPSTPQRQGFSLNLKNRRQSLSQSHKQEGRFPNISFKYNLLKQAQF